MTGTGVVDAHHHLWELGVRNQDWIDPDTMADICRDFTVTDLAGEAATAGVTATVLVQTVPVAAETPELLAIAQRSQGSGGDGLVAGVVGWVDLTAPDVTDALAALRAAPGGEYLVGIRHLVQSEPDPGWLTRPDVARGLRAVADAGLVYDLLTLPHQLPAAVQTVRALPELRFVLDHLGKPRIAEREVDGWADDLRALATAGNVAAKLSGLVTEADPDRWTVADLRPYADVALDAFGADRLMFGSDWPVCLLAASYPQVLGAARELTDDLTPSEQSAVFGGTARRWYGLPDAATPSAPTTRTPTRRD